MKNMSLKTFTRNLRRGLGSAIVELQNNPDKERYHDILLRSCLKDIAHDTQVEGDTRGHYLYMAINALGPPQVFLDAIIQKYENRLYLGLSHQLFDLLCCFSDDGYKTAEDALEKKYSDLKNRIPRMSEHDRYWEQAQLERLMVRKLDNGFDTFKQCLGDLGEMLPKRGDGDFIWFDWFLDEARKKFGDNVFEYVERLENENVIAFHYSYKKIFPPQKDKSRKGKNAKKEWVSIEQLIDRANEIAAKKRFNPGQIYLHQRDFEKHAKKEDFVSLARFIIDEPSDLVKAVLLRVFRHIAFPLDVELLFPFTRSDCEPLSLAASTILSRVNDERVHVFAHQLFEEGDVQSALMLMESNFKPEDEALIRKHVLRSKRITYWMTSSLICIYETNKSNTCGDILMHFYTNEECSHCRGLVVGLMIDQEVMPQKTLEECLYDSYEATRVLAQKTISGHH